MLFPQRLYVVWASSLLVASSTTAFSPSAVSLRSRSTFGVPSAASVSRLAESKGSKSESSESESSSDNLLLDDIQQIANQHVLDHVCHNPITSLNLQDYKSEQCKSIDRPEQYWYDKATELLAWDRPPASADEVLKGSFAEGDVTWFAGSKLNVCYNAIDRYANTDPNRIAIRWEGDDPADVLELTFADAQREVSRIANALKSKGVRKGDVVTLYMPMLPALPLTMLACARIGAGKYSYYRVFTEY
jgi:hypothetical protein